MMRSCDMLDALHKARAINRLIADRYPERPEFQTLGECDARHVMALVHLFSLMNWPFPEDRWAGVTFTGDSFSALVAQSLQAEADCVRTYDMVLASTADPTVRTVVGNLRKTSLDWRLPALEALEAAIPAAPPAFAEAMRSARP